jgi:hypothetical protein
VPDSGPKHNHTRVNHENDMNTGQYMLSSMPWSSMEWKTWSLLKFKVTSMLMRSFAISTLYQTCVYRFVTMVPHRKHITSPLRAHRLMLSIGFSRWYINVTIPVLDIIHRPVFYLKLNSTLWVFSYLTGNTLRLRYEPNRLMLSIGLWRWFIDITITILNIIHRPVFNLKLNSTL